MNISVILQRYAGFMVNYRISFSMIGEGGPVIAYNFLFTAKL